ncbi:hypothetical protein ACFFIX_20440 [Metabacillus herbersteinensis]|uniref:Uncharacterized protein n=1 Tax=Metabacillus herbersteinensis TaxID=283816 RepID=A0ABV6GKT9_9BACI
MNKTIESTEDLFKYTDQKLKAHFQNSEFFNKEFAIMVAYYRSKFEGLIQEVDTEGFDGELFQSAKSQFFNGYYIIRELISNSETKIEDEWFSQPEGLLTEQIPDLIKDLAQESFDDVVITDTMHQFTMKAITKYEDVINILKQIAFDIVCLGAKQAILDEREKRGLIPFKSEMKGLLANVEDLTFINPQQHLSCTVITLEAEIWTLSWWSSIHTNDNKAGEVSIITIPVEDSKKYALNINLSNRIQDNQRKKILEAILFSLMERNNVKREAISVNFAVVEDFYILINE